MIYLISISMGRLEGAIEAPLVKRDLEFAMKNEQFDSIWFVVAGRDVLAALPAGCGKSLIYSDLFKRKVLLVLKLRPFFKRRNFSLDKHH